MTTFYCEVSHNQQNIADPLLFFFYFLPNHIFVGLFVGVLSFFRGGGGVTQFQEIIIFKAFSCLYITGQDRNHSKESLSQIILVER